MKFILATFVVLGVAAQIAQVVAVKCDANSKCVKTDFTTATCESNKCKCIAGYVAKDEGCIKKPSKPTVTTPSGNNKEAVHGATGIQFTCATEVYTVSPTTTFKWEKDGTDQTDVTPTASYDIGTADIKVRCAVEFRGVLSDWSDVVTIKYLVDASTTTSAAEPVLRLSSPKVGKTKDFEVFCTGHPIGSTVEIKSGATTITGKQIFDPTKTSDKFTCTFSTTNSITFSNSPREINYPTEITSIDKIEVTIGDQPVPKLVAYTVSQAPTLTCKLTPGADFFETTPTYVWSETTYPPAATHKITAAGNYKDITCTATEGSKSATSENKYEIIVDDDYLKTPKVVLDPAKPVADTQISLTCETEETNVVFGWSKGGATIYGQLDQTIQYGKVAAADAGDYTCSITKNGFTKTSDKATVAVATDIDKPTVQIKDSASKQFGLWGDFELECSSPNAVPIMTYTWAKGGNTIAKATESSYTIDEVEKTDAGKFTCTTTLRTLTKTSDEFELEIVDPGVQCTANAGCDKTKDKTLSGTCDTTAKRCECIKNYYRKGNGCGNGVAQMAASLIVVLVAALVSRLM